MKPVDADAQRRERFTQGRTTEEQRGTGQAETTSTTVPAWLLQCRLVLDDVVPGWICCQCKTYNDMQLDACKQCSHRCCVKKPGI